MVLASVVVSFVALCLIGSEILTLAVLLIMALWGFFKIIQEDGKER